MNPSGPLSPEPDTSPTGTPGLVIFDHDGVLVDSLLMHEEAWLELGRRAGLPIDRDFVRATFGLTNPDILAGLPGPPLDRDQIDALGEEKERCYRAIAGSRLRLMDGAEGLIGALRSVGHRLAIGSSGPRANLELTVERCGLAGAFAAIVGLEDVRRGKPDPEVFLIAAERAGVEPRDAVVLEDSPMGIWAAKAAGMSAVAITWTHPTPVLLDAGADRVVAHLAELEPEALTTLARSR